MSLILKAQIVNQTSHSDSIQKLQLVMMMDDFGFFIIATDLCLSHFCCVARTYMYVDLSAGTCDFVTLSGPKWSGCGYVT